MTIVDNDGKFCGSDLEVEGGATFAGAVLFRFVTLCFEESRSLSNRFIFSEFDVSDSFSDVFELE